MKFFEKLEARVKKVNSLLCVGLDPIAKSANEARDICLNLIQSTAPYAAAFKPNSAFFECHGPAGMLVLAAVIEAIPDDIPVILDVKRGDIGSTAEKYRDAAFNVYKADAVTVNPYMGQDAIEPFSNTPEKGVFVLCHTSNKGASNFQELWVANSNTSQYSHRLYSVVADLAQEWDRYGNIGLVIGASNLQTLEHTRNRIPDMWFLIPGVGAQGGTVEDVVDVALRKDGMGALISVSRSIMQDDNPGRAAKDFRDSINTAKVRSQKKKMPNSKLADALVETGCVKFGKFTLKSGIESPIYIDLRRLISYPEVLKLASKAMVGRIKTEMTVSRPEDGLWALEYKFDRLAALPLAGLPLGTAMGLETGWSVIFPRLSIKKYGTKSSVEGEFEENDRVVLIDDLITDGGSKLEAIEVLRGADLIVENVVVLIDRESGGREDLIKYGCKLDCVFQLSNLVDYWETMGLITTEQATTVREFLNQ